VSGLVVLELVWTLLKITGPSVMTPRVDAWLVGRVTAVCVQGSAGEPTVPSVGARVTSDVVELCKVVSVCISSVVVAVVPVLETGRYVGFSVRVKVTQGAAVVELVAAVVTVGTVS
jgi:hypothetical protein